jgi:hypothetical protein
MNEKETKYTVFKVYSTVMHFQVGILCTVLRKSFFSVLLDRGIPTEFDIS